jgi:orotidine-5'-phosphate decarboxylase
LIFILIFDNLIPVHLHMSSRNFRDMLEARWANNRFVCVGLDSEWSKIPRHLKPIPDSGGDGYVVTTVNFNSAIVEATRDLVCDYKPNTAFYEARGVEGIEALRQTIMKIQVIAPEVPVILDAKRADIGNTNNGYVEFAFDYLGADAITVHPYLGSEALAPFLERKDKGIIVLCRTSNPGAGEFQDIKIEMGPVLVDDEPRYRPLYQVIARQVAEKWNNNGNCAVVVGATYPHELFEVRRIVGDLPILIPGIGAQGGDVEATVKAGRDSRGQGMIINSSRGIIFASSGEDFADAARRETQRLSDLINQYRGVGQEAR